MTSASRYSEMAAIQDTQMDAPGPGKAKEAQPASELNRLPNRQPPLANSCWLHGTRPGPGEVNIIAGQQALRQIALHGDSDLRSELGGALLGHAYRYEQRVYVDIKAALPVVSGDHGPVHFTFSADSWAQLHQDRSARYPDLDIVGWFHTHPDLGVFYSGDDVVVHSAAFTLPWHVGLVLDPIRQEGSFFGWVDGALSPISGFYERHEGEEESATNWKLVPSAVWNESHQPDAKAGNVYAPANSWPGLPSFAAPLGILVGILGLSLGFFLLVGWVIPLNRQLDRLENVVLMLADEGLSNEIYASCPDSRLRILSPMSGARIVAGDEMSVVGTAEILGAYRYRVEMRATGDTEWTLVASRRRDSNLGQLAAWDTSDHQPRLYELRLTAVDRNNIILADSPVCLVEVELLP